MAAGAAQMKVQQQLPMKVCSAGAGTVAMKVMKKTKGAHTAETKETDAKKAKTTANPRIRQRQEANDRNKAEIVKHVASVEDAHVDSRLAAAKKAEANAEATMVRSDAVLAEADAKFLESEALLKKARMYASAANLDSQALLDEAKNLIGGREATKPEWRWWGGSWWIGCTGCKCTWWHRC
jgi:hypothetical protein